MLKRFAWAAMAAGSILLAGAATAAPARYEAANVIGSTTAPTGLFRIEVATGKAVQAWGANLQWTPTVDSAPLPPGEYHLIVSTNPSGANGAVSWAIHRYDAVSGRTWVGLGGGDKPLTWNEILMPK